jgi:hypothetical protein
MQRRRGIFFDVALKFRRGRPKNRTSALPAWHESPGSDTRNRWKVPRYFLASPFSRLCKALARHCRAALCAGNMKKELAMLTTSPTTATPFSNDNTNTAKTAAVEAHARASFRDEMRTAFDNEKRVSDNADTAAARRRATTEVPDPMTSLSTVAVAGAMNSLPAALNMMRSIALASASGTLSDSDRQTLQSEYAQLSAKAVASVGSIGASEQAQTSTTHDDERGDTAENTRREDSDDRRSTLTQTREVPQETVQYQPVERTSTVHKQTLVTDGHAMQKDPRVDFRTHELHVGTDSHEPVSMRQSFSHPTTPETFGRIETHAATLHSFVAQAAQITRFVQVAQTGHIAPVVAVA